MEVIIEEVKLFKRELKSILKDLVITLKHQIIENHSTRTEFGEYGPYEIKQIVKSLTFNIHIIIPIESNFITAEESDIRPHFVYSPIVKSDGLSISSGQTNSIIWEFINSRIDFEKYPHFRKPVFSGRMEVI